MGFAEEYDRAFSAYRTGAMARTETPEDLPALTALAVACSPMRNSLPAAMIEQQAGWQVRAHAAAYPDAMRRAIERDGRLIGHIVVDWHAAGEVQGVDIAVDPAERAGAPGLAMLRAWLAVADAHRLACRLTVRQDNPARRIYRFLGFVELAGQSPDAPNVEMARAPR